MIFRAPDGDDHGVPVYDTLHPDRVATGSPVRARGATVSGLVAGARYRVVGVDDTGSYRERDFIP